MTHSLIRADRGTHVKIVSVALVGAIVVSLVAATARLSRIETATGPVLRAGKPAAFAAGDATTVR
jgi:hypothetical protein